MLKAECSLEKIKTAILQVEKITGKNLTLPVLNSILIEAQKKKLKIKATNLSLGIEVEIPAKIEKEGIVAVSGTVLAGFFSNIQKEDSIFFDGSDGKLLVKTKNNKTTIKTQPHEDFPTIPIVEGNVVELDVVKFIQGIKSVYYSAAISDIKPEISSVCIYSEDDYLFFVSTDSFRLAEKKIKIKGNNEIQKILIPHKNTPEIIRIFGDMSGEVKMSFNKNQMALSCGGVYLTSRLIDGVFPDYRQIIPKETKTEVVVLKQDLLNALKLSNIFSDKFNQINIVIKPKEKMIELSSSNNDVGENRTFLDGVLSGEAVDLGLNYRYFFDLFQSINTDSVSIKMNQNTKPVIVSGVSDSSFLYLIMPMNK